MGKKRRITDRYPEKTTVWNYSRRGRGGKKGIGTYQTTQNYFKDGEELPTYVLLAMHAKQIQMEEANSKTRANTVVLCVALREKTGCVKRFVFHNNGGSSPMPPVMRTRAENLGYDVAKTERSHAEGNLLQCLHKRAGGRPGLYTHIVAMGGSQRHCGECDAVMRLVLGEAYQKVTGAAKQSGAASAQRSVTLHSKKGGGFSLQTVQQEEAKFTVVQGTEAVGPVRIGEQDKYCLPEGLRVAIEEQGGRRLVMKKKAARYSR